MEDRERENYESYMAQCLWTATSIISQLGGHELDFPQYIELTHPETKKRQPTAQQIKDHVVGRLLEG